MPEIGKWQWFDYDDADSTNDTALTLSQNPSAEYFVVTAKRQHNGRGRRGRSWISQEGNLFMSLGLPFDINDINALVFITALSLFEAVASQSPQGCLQLKWPNDVLFNNQKISGILLEKGFQNYIAALLIRAFVFDSSGNDGYAKGIFEEARQQLDEIVEKIKGVNDSEEDD